ncbi:hypothetical protein HDV57DRAFT_488434 [Trichoderma longibrachiatum]
MFSIASVVLALLNDCISAGKPQAHCKVVEVRWPVHLMHQAVCGRLRRMEASREKILSPYEVLVSRHTSDPKKSS